MNIRKNRKIFTAFSLIVTFLLLIFKQQEELYAASNSYDTLSNKKYSWYMIRQKNHEPTGSPKDVDIAKYDGYYLNKDAKDDVMYFTFDCGYEMGYTSTILDTLKEHNVKAMFFVTKAFISKETDLVKRMKKEGHLVGNHTSNHPSMPLISTAKLQQEITENEALFKEKTGYDMDKFLRPPMGEYSERTLQFTKDLGYKTIFWSMAFQDYDVNNQPGKEYVVNHFNTYYHRGAIPLLHNVSKSDTEALGSVITNLKLKGYRFGSLDELGVTKILEPKIRKYYLPSGSQIVDLFASGKN